MVGLRTWRVSIMRGRGARGPVRRGEAGNLGTWYYAQAVSVALIYFPSYLGGLPRSGKFGEDASALHTMSRLRGAVACLLPLCHVFWRLSPVSANRIPRLPLIGKLSRMVPVISTSKSGGNCGGGYTELYGKRPYLETPCESPADPLYPDKGRVRDSGGRAGDLMIEKEGKPI